MAETSVLSFDEVAWLRDNSPAWRLLRADNAPLVLSFLHQVFVAENVRSIPAAGLASRLDDELYALNQRDGDAKTFPKPAKAYLDDWTAPEAGWLRKYYPEGTDEQNAVWYADVPNRRCARVAEGGTVLQTVELDRGGFACMLGGPDRTTLFIVAARWQGMTEREMVAPGSGQVLTTDVDVPGAGWP